MRGGRFRRTIVSALEGNRLTSGYGPPRRMPCHCSLILLCRRVFDVVLINGLES